MIRTVLFWLVCSGMVLVLGPPFILMSYFDRRKIVMNKIVLLWSWILLKIAGVKLHIENEEMLKKYSQYVLVCNHQSYMDIFCLIYTLKKCPHFLAKKELFRIPLFGQALRAIDVIEIDRENAEAALSSIKRTLAKGLSNPICIFPEGTRSPNGRLQPFRKKGLSLLMETGLPVIPAAFYGTRNVMPKGKYTVKPSKVCFVVGEPIFPPKGLSPEEKLEVIQKLWHLVYDLREKAEKSCSK